MNGYDIVEYIKERSVTNLDAINRTYNFLNDLNDITYITKIEDIPDLIVVVTCEYCDNNRDEIEDVLNEFIKEFNEDKFKYISNIKIIYDDLCIEENICPICGNNLKTYSELESRGEYFGYQCSEKVNEVRCETCGFTL